MKPIEVKRNNTKWFPVIKPLIVCSNEVYVELSTIMDFWSDSNFSLLRVWKKKKRRIKPQLLFHEFTRKKEENHKYIQFKFKYCLEGPFLFNRKWCYLHPPNQDRQAWPCMQQVAARRINSGHSFPGGSWSRYFFLSLSRSRFQIFGTHDTLTKKREFRFQVRFVPWLKDGLGTGNSETGSDIFCDMTRRVRTAAAT